MTESQHDIPISTKPSFLKRWLGWRILALSAVVLILLSPLLYRGWRLGRVPPSEEPFPVDEFPKAIPEEENAAPLLFEAIEKIVGIAPSDSKKYIAESMDGWNPGDETLDRYLERNQTSLELWRKAVLLSNYQLDFDSQDDESELDLILKLRDLNQFAINQIEKLIRSNRATEAIPWIDAHLRFSYLIRKNSSESHLFWGAAFFAISANAVDECSQNPELSRDEIDQVRGALRTAHRLCPPLSENVKVGYLATRKVYRGWSYEEYAESYRKHGAKPPIASKWKSWIDAEPEYTLKLLPLIAKNHLMFIDEPRRDRPPLVSDDLFHDSSVSTAERGGLDVNALQELIEDSQLLNPWSLLQQDLDVFDRDEARYRCLTVALSAQAYFRDHGEFPAHAKQLVPEYLDELPDDLYSPTPAPLIYRRDGNGAVVYSRYQNEIDDGGSVVNYDEHRTGGDLLDFGFRIRNPFEQPLTAPKP